MQKFDAVFSIDEGELSLQGLLLLASLKCHTDCKIHIIIPKNSRDKIISLNTFSKYAHIYERDIPTRNFQYRIGYKFHAFDIDYNTDRIIFFDTDTMVVKQLGMPFNNLLTSPYDIIAPPPPWKGLWLKTRSLNEIICMWKNIYGIFNLEIPNIYIKTLMDKQKIPLRLNTAIIICSSKLNLSSKWIETAILIEDNAQKFQLNPYPYLDMMALSITLQRENLSWSLLPEKYVLETGGSFSHLEALQSCDHLSFKEIKYLYNHFFIKIPKIASDTDIIHYKDYSGLLRAIRTIPNAKQSFISCCKFLKINPTKFITMLGRINPTIKNKLQPLDANVSRIIMFLAQNSL